MILISRYVFVLLVILAVLAAFSARLQGDTLLDWMTNREECEETVLKAGG